MKKLLTTLTLFAALILTSCGGASNSSNAGSSSATKHEHTFNESVWEKNETQHWHPATCEHTDVKGNAAAHDFKADTSKTNKAATCDEEGVEYLKCSVCGYEKENKLPALAHDFSGAVLSAQDPVDGCTNSSLVKCKNCNKMAIRWAAKDYNTDESEDIEATKSDGSIRLQNGQYWKKDGNNGSVDETVNGSHLIYYINSYAAAEKVGLNFHIKQKSDWSGALFDAQSGDQIKGQIKNEDGSFTAATKRYGLKINDVEVALGEDKTNVDQGVEGWFDWPVSFNLKEGKNKIEITCLGGYRAYLFDFQFTGLPAKQA